MSKGYIIIDECGKNVVGYVECGGVIKYISHSNNESCSIGVIQDKKELEKKLSNLQKISDKIKDGHTFSYKNI